MGGVSPLLQYLWTRSCSFTDQSWWLYGFYMTLNTYCVTAVQADGQWELMRVTLNCKREGTQSWPSITGWITSTCLSFHLCRHRSKERLLTSISCRACVSSFIYPNLSCAVPPGTVVTGVWSPDTLHPDTIPPACLWTLSSFAAWLDHQPCKEDLWPWSTQNDICWGLGNHGESDEFRAKSLVVVCLTRKRL